MSWSQRHRRSFPMTPSATYSSAPRRTIPCASLCCKPWRRLLSDPAFCRAYRELHRRTPPLFGSIHNKGRVGKPYHCVLVPTTAFRPPGGTDRRKWIALDSRHGGVLLYSFTLAPDIEFVLWDPITLATVLCAMDGCHHIDCQGGPFLVAFAGIRKLAFASVYSSMTGDWSDTQTAFVDRMPPWRSTLAI